MELASPDHDAVALFLHHMKVHVRIGLLDGPLQAFALDVGLGAAPDQVFVLETGKPFQEVLVILGLPAVELVGFK